MPPPLQPLFIQRKTHRGGGAQNSLLRILRHPAMAREKPILLCGDEGWLAESARSAGTTVLLAPFPRGGLRRRWNQRRFVAQVHRQLEAQRLTPRLVHVNDYFETRETLALARHLQVPALLTLRGSRITRRQFLRRRCHQADAIIANGPWMHERVRGWCRQAVHVIPNGLGEEEFTPPAPLAAAPARLLVLGRHDPVKGWADFCEAWRTFPRPEALEPITCIFPDTPPPAGSELLPPPPAWQFVGRQDSLRPLLHEADLVIHPSRAESFGMAALETIAAGRPLITTDTGVIPELLPPSPFRVPPSDPSRLAAALHHALRNWPEVDFGRTPAQQRLKQQYGIDATVEQLLGLYLAALEKDPTSRSTAAG